MLLFDLYDSEYGGGSSNVDINPVYVESVVAGERRTYGSHYDVAIITMASGATHVVHDPGRRVAMQIMSAMQQPEVQP